jgi:hypothetical protein
MTRNAVMLDTSFFLRFLNVNDQLFSNTDGYYRYFLDHEIDMVISTISIAEYCVRGDISELPLRHLKIIPFNVNHAKKAGEFARVVFQNKDELKLPQRSIIPNDTKLFAQADIESNVQYYLTTDKESYKIFTLLKNSSNPRFHFIDMKNPFSETFGVLEL